MDQAQPTSETLKRDRLLFLFLAILLVAATVAVTIQMLRPSNRSAVQASLIQDGLAIISASQSWVNHLPAEATVERGAFAHLRFDRIGYFDGLTADGRSMINEHGIYTLVVAPDGEHFTLEATGPDDIKVVWEDVGREGVPDANKL